MTGKQTAKQTGKQTEKRVLDAIQQIADARHIPAATYRLQFNADFTFDHARGLLPYLDDLGVSDLYASPIFLPRQGSTHGYDVADPTRLNSDLGSEADFDALSSALQKRNMNLVLDIVPNHMGINDSRNGWWLDVLENGPSSDFASFFDIEWHPVQHDMADKVLLPILGDQYGVVLERGELRLHYENGTFYLTYYATTLPLAPSSYATVLRLALGTMTARANEMAAQQAAQMAAQTGTETSVLPLPSVAPPSLSAIESPLAHARLELESVLTALNYLPARTESDPQRLAERAREKEVVKRRLDTLYGESEDFRAALDAAITVANGKVGEPHSFDLLDQLIEEQSYRLAFWRVAGEEINYRRFFDINELAALRVEEPHVFATAHALAFHLLAEGKARALRIDHPDGLYDPVSYFSRLQQHFLFAKLRRAGAAESGQNENGLEGAAAMMGDDELLALIQQWLDEQARQGEGARWPLYVVAEKILSENEPLPPDWAVHGTTGYDFLTAANGIFVAQHNEKSFTRLYSRFSRSRTTLRTMTFETKMMIMRDSLAGEITTLAMQLERIGERNRHYRDFTLGGLRTALREVVACLTIYRTYINAHQAGSPDQPSERDSKFVRSAVREAKRRRPLLDDTLFEYIEDTLLLRNMEKFAEADRPAVAHWVMKFQQLTGPVMAKGVEDTAFYRYNRLVSLNEVGDHPSQFGTSVEQFHEENQRRAQLWPYAMLATSTHDNKRSEDVRARINVLSEMPDRWQSCLSKWSRVNASKKRELEGASAPENAPDANDEYLFYQTLLGVWPLAESLAEEATQANVWGALLSPGDDEQYQTFKQRIRDYMLKAAKEAKVYTSWLNPYEEYEEALTRFVERVLQPSTRNRFLTDLAPLAASVAYFGHFNSLGQTLLKLTAPGVPDIYQGNELWNFSLVDPDNRRAVDYGRRAALLKQMAAAGRRKESGQLRYARELVEQWHDGRIKLWVTLRTLHFRRENATLFAGGAYVPLEATGERSDHLCAYMRQDDNGQVALIVVPRLVATLMEREQRPPLGNRVWGDSAILLPNGAEGRGYRNVFTGEEVAPVRVGSGWALPVAKLLGNFPVALLV
jgi:(1->4)-alpha-D-glucan 1-alpha-D-glucosylmutase